MQPSTNSPQNYDFIEELKEAAVHGYDFRLMPVRWSQFQRKTVLQWQRYMFDQSIIDKIPDEPGVYAFCIEPGIADNLNVCYLMYVGETTRQLKTRFREYLREMNDPNGRPPIIRLLKLYGKFLYFYCAPLHTSITPQDIENELLNAFTPPTNTQLPAKVRRIESAF